MNILIGPNNSGKSTVIRYLMKFAGWLTKGNWNVPSELEDSDCWQYQAGHVSQVEIETRMTPSGGGILDKLTNPEGCICLTMQPQRNISTIDIVPTFFGASDPVPLWTWASDKKTKTFAEGDEAAYSMVLSQLFPMMSKSFVFFDAIRALDRSGNQGMEDGSTLLKAVVRDAVCRKSRIRVGQFPIPTA